MLTEKDFRLLVTTSDGSVADVTLTRSVHTGSGFSLSKDGLRSWLAEFNLLAAVGKQRESQFAQALKADKTVTMISDNGSFWGPKPFEGLIFVDLSPTELWNRINKAQESKHACVDLTEVTGPDVFRKTLQRKLAAVNDGAGIPDAAPMKSEPGNLKSLSERVTSGPSPPYGWGEP